MPAEVKKGGKPFTVKLGELRAEMFAAKRESRRRTRSAWIDVPDEVESSSTCTSCPTTRFADDKKNAVKGVVSGPSLSMEKVVMPLVVTVARPPRFKPTTAGSVFKTTM